VSSYTTGSVSGSWLQAEIIATIASNVIVSFFILQSIRRSITFGLVFFTADEFLVSQSV
jgi:hypothetical protein